MGEITRRNRGILLSIFIIVSVLSDYILIGPYGFITVLAPSVGLILVYHMYYKDYFLLSIIVYALGLLVTRFIFIEETIFISIFIVFFKSLVLFCMLLLVDHVVFHLKDNGYKDMNLRDILNYILIGIFIPLLGATMHLIPIHYVFDYDNSLFWYVNSLIGYMFGFFIFGSALYFAFIYDKNKISRKEFLLFNNLFGNNSNLINDIIFT